jgi:hypothetical protein
MPLDDFSKSGDLSRWYSAVRCQLNLGPHPELRLTLGRDDVDMHSRLFEREEEEPVWSFAKDRRTHERHRTALRVFRRDSNSVSMLLVTDTRRMAAEGDPDAKVFARLEL